MGSTPQSSGGFCETNPKKNVDQDSGQARSDPTCLILVHQVHLSISRFEERRPVVRWTAQVNTCPHLSILTNTSSASKRRRQWLLLRDFSERSATKFRSQMLYFLPSSPSTILLLFRVRFCSISSKFFFVTVRSQYFFFIFGLGIGFLGRISSAMEFGRGQRVRRISTTFPVCMGRRSCKIAGRKVRFLVSNICFFFPLCFF